MGGRTGVRTLAVGNPVGDAGAVAFSRGTWVQSVEAERGCGSELTFSQKNHLRWAEAAAVAAAAAVAVAAVAVAAVAAVAVVAAAAVTQQQALLRQPQPARPRAKHL